MAAWWARRTLQGLLEVSIVDFCDRFLLKNVGAPTSRTPNPTECGIAGANSWKKVVVLPACPELGRRVAGRDARAAASVDVARDIDTHSPGRFGAQGIPLRFEKKRDSSLRRLRQAGSAGRGGAVRFLAQAREPS